MKKKKNRYLCPKCGSEDQYIQHHAKWEAEYSGQDPRYPDDNEPRTNLGEHLTVHCRCCQFRRIMPTLDSRPAPKARRKGGTR